MEVEEWVRAAVSGTGAPLRWPWKGAASASRPPRGGLGILRAPSDLWDVLRPAEARTAHRGLIPEDEPSSRHRRFLGSHSQDRRHHQIDPAPLPFASGDFWVGVVVNPSLYPGWFLMHSQLGVQGALLRPFEFLELS